MAVAYGIVLAEVFSAARGEPAQAAWEPALEAALGAARAAVDFPVDGAGFAQALGRSEAGGVLTAGAEVSTEALVEVAVVAGLEVGEPRALRFLEARWVTPLTATLGRLRLSASDLDEVLQRVRERLLVVEDGVRRLDGYAGRGRLGGLLQVVATREALTLLRQERRDAPVDPTTLEDAAATAWDPALTLGTEAQRRALRAALGEALVALPARERALLRLHLLGGVTLDRLAAQQGVHRATVVRWLAAARRAVLDGTRARLRAALALHEGELDQVMELARSRLDVSVERLLGSSGE